MKNLLARLLGCTKVAARIYGTRNELLMEKFIYLQTKRMENKLCVVPVHNPIEFRLGRRASVRRFEIELSTASMFYVDVEFEVGKTDTMVFRIKSEMMPGDMEQITYGIS